MNTKNLPMKFALFVLLPALLCLWSLVLGKGLNYGIDISGGTVMEFRIRPSGTGGDPANLSRQAIGVLKNRIDPDGLRNLEWTPIGSNRFEVRMPAASGRSRQAKQEYLDALNRLEATNLQRSEVQSLLDAPGDERNEVIASIAGDDTAMARKLEALSAADLALEAAREALEDVRAAEAELPETGAEARREELIRRRLAAQAALTDAREAYEQLRSQLYATNVSRTLVENVLRGYLSPREKAMIATEDEVIRRQEAFDRAVAQLKKRFEVAGAETNPRLELLKEVIAEYKDWANVRQHLEDPQDLVRLIRKAGVLEFRIAPVRRRTGENDLVLQEETVSRMRRLLQEEGPQGPALQTADWAWFPIKEDAGFEDFIFADYAGKTYVLLSNTGELSMLQGIDAEWRLADAFPERDGSGRPAVGFTFDSAGSTRFGRLTSQNIGRPLAILLDDQVYSAPRINSIITQRGIITGSFSPEEVASLVGTLRAGRLHGRIDPEPVSVRTFAPTIGQENANRGFYAAIIGLVAVVGFVLMYYLAAGAVADVALLLNLILVLGAMSLFGARLTLPGIAGIILTIGIAVDANVLIFERLREEQTKNQPLRMALKNAYERAFSAIFDANATTLITCLILAWVGTEEVRGFAITLGFGVLFSLFTALIITRWVFQVLLDAGLLKNRLPMLRLIGTPTVNWFNKRYAFWAVSAVMVVLGVGSLLWQGSDILGIEFSSGSKATITLKQGALIDGRLPTRNRLADRLTAEMSGPEFKKFRDSLEVTAVLNPQADEEFLALYDRDDDGTVTRSEYLQGPDASEAFFQALTGGATSITAAELAEKLPARVYELTTTARKPVPVEAPADANALDANALAAAAATADGESGRNPLATAIDRALGNEGLLDRRRPLSYTRVAGVQSGELNIRLAAEGATRITEDMVAENPSFFQPVLQDFTGGVVFVVDNVQPAQTEAALRERIDDTRSQPDFADAAAGLQQIRAVALDEATDGGHRRFAIFISAAEPIDPVQSPEMWDRFTETAYNWGVAAPLQREDSLVIKAFDPAVAGAAVGRAIVAVVLSCVAIIAYLWLRFGSARWGLAAIVCLLHDVLIIVGLVAVSGWLSELALGQWLGVESFKIDLVMVAALLTIIGYSVNDTIVIFDRIRENRGRLETVRPEVINTSVNQTLSRTLLTSGTTFIVVIIMYVWGGPGIHSFSFALLMGVIFGTYSSVAVAAPLLTGVKQAIAAKAAPVEA